jgi:hypothetical protein
MLAVLAAGALGASPAGAQVNLQDLLLDLLRTGVTLAPPAEGVNHSAHFTAGAEEEDDAQYAAVKLLNSEIGRQLANFPLSSSAGSFSYELDPALGILTRPTQSFGSVYAERPFTVGRGKYNLGISFAQFSYDAIDGVRLRDGDLRLVFLHEDAAGDGRDAPFFEGDIITATLFVDLDVNVSTISATYGVSDRFDMGLVVPVVDVSLAYSSAAHVEQLSTGDAAPDTHIFTNGTTSNAVRRGGEATGVGDVSLRGRWLPGDFEPEEFRAAVTGEIRFPTGDEKNFLGSGGTQLEGSLLFSKPFGAASWRGGAGVAYGTNDLPFEMHYSTGMDWAVDPKLTLAVDLLGLHLAEQAQVSVEDVTYTYNESPGGPVSLAQADFPTLQLEGEDTGRDEVRLSLGFKLNVASTVLVTANGLVPLNETGLQDDFSTLVGVDYSF